jgi:DNA-binding transcriptional ArsR family regulator
MSITKALADENRVRILAALKGRELCVCQIIDLLQLAPSTVSKHLSILRQARLLEARKNGRWMYYRLNEKNPPAAVSEALAWVIVSVGNEALIQDDARRLREILSVPVEDRCGGQ